jgi:hypothetical protein
MRDIWTHLFLPHHTNNHKAKVLQIDALFIYLLFFVIFNVTVRTIHKEAPQVLGYATSIYVEQLLSDTNEVRKNAGLSPLILNSQLSQAAADKAQYMFSHNFWAHNSPDGKTPWEFISATGYKYTVAGENLAKNFNDSQGVVDAWVASPSHRDNLLKSSYRDVGFAVLNGVLNGEETTLVVQMFGSTESIIANKPPVVPVQAAKVEPKTGINQPSNATDQVIPVKINAVPDAIMPPSQNLQNTSIQMVAGSGIKLTPFINLNTVVKSVSLAFTSMLIILFIIDMFVVTRKRIVRVTGHSLAHILFFISLTIILTLSVPGVII